MLTLLTQLLAAALCSWFLAVTHTPRVQAKALRGRKCLECCCSIFSVCDWLSSRARVALESRSMSSYDPNRRQASGDMRNNVKLGPKRTTSRQFTQEGLELHQARAGLWPPRHPGATCRSRRKILWNQSKGCHWRRSLACLNPHRNPLTPIWFVVQAA